MKKGVMSLLSLALSVSMLAGCGSKPEEGATGGAGGEAPKASFTVGMVTDAGTIDDKSFNQGTYEGIERANKDFGTGLKYQKPAGTTEAEYTKEIGNLYDAGYKFIVTPGFKFETAIFKAQEKYKDAKFVLIDGAPNSGEPDAKPVVADNTVSIFFAEQESGFLAGVATALQLKEGEAGFIGGIQIPPVQKFNWGFQQGLNYANENLDTKVEIKKDNVVYQGTFDNVAAGGQLASQMYSNGVKVIFAAAGGVGVGAIQEAVTRAKGGDEVWIVGVDVDQYNDGVYGDKSVVLTSAVKKIDQAAYDMIKAETEGKFPGGQTLTLDAKSDGVGLPAENPNLSEEVLKQVDEVLEKIKSGEITVSAEQGDLLP
ncbi:BMP family lipoprotein [Paenibacillus lemnae]|uniref:BMP family ABC transporter substrate-binding protein n=1 Tax=Paenibacillus lemnae TaxID=1330551 RepID=A0A848MBM2_PAELE|nr:BMP family ABC transporter substrate-binding protein [Paenibacillus lemnae]NMO97581.1 BMP family ABC transporter substrate-binding protein [Paenibacillus lemnae]